MLNTLFHGLNMLLDCDLTLFLELVVLLAKNKNIPLDEDLFKSPEILLCNLGVHQNFVGFLQLSNSFFHLRNFLLSFNFVLMLHLLHNLLQLFHLLLRRFMLSSKVHDLGNLGLLTCHKSLLLGFEFFDLLLGLFLALFLLFFVLLLKFLNRGLHLYEFGLLFLVVLLELNNCGSFCHCLKTHLFLQFFFGFHSSPDLSQHRSMHIPPSEGFLQLDPCFLTLHQKGENGLLALDPAPHSLNQHGLLAAPADPFHDLAAEAALSKGTLQLDNNAFVLARKVHHALAPALTLNVAENEALNNFACL